MRDKRAQGIAAMGLVTRDGDRFGVASPSLRGRTAKYEVWRDEGGRVRCSCLEFEEAAETDASFRCEHILAVKHHLLAKPAMKTEEGNSAVKKEQKPGATKSRATLEDAPNPLKPDLATLVNLGSLAVHIEEFLDNIPGGGASLYEAARFDVAAIRTSLDQIAPWREAMDAAAYLPKKR